MKAGRHVPIDARGAHSLGITPSLAAGLLSLLIVTTSAAPLHAETVERLRVASVEGEVAQAEASRDDAEAPETNAKSDKAKSDTAKPESGKDASARADAPPASPMVAGAPIRAANPRALYRALIEREVRHTSLPADVAEAVMGVESGYEPSRIGADGEIGLMQVMPATARMLGFNGSMTEFAAPEINIKYGVMYLSQAWSKAGGDLCTALMKYRAGHGETRFSQLSVDYCIKARARLVGKGYVVTGSVPVATFGFRPGLGGALASTNCRKRCLTLGGTGRVDFGALNSRLAQVAIQVNSPRLAGK
jgi:soluble lytic murein transglycosylase-like protein